MQSLTTVAKPTMAQQVEQAVQKEIKMRLDQLHEDLVKKYVSEFERQVREVIGHVALSLSSYYSIEHQGTDIVIRVKID